MRTIVFLAVTFLAHIAAAADQIFPLEAANHVEEQSTVCGVVVSAKYAISTQGSPTFLNLDKPYPNVSVHPLTPATARGPILG
ncbi:MAG: hypothetical protein WCI11_20325, partial [Candidatus Methylumidiphilus sp.]